MIWFIPTFFGDFRLSMYKGKTKLKVTRATDLEKKQLCEFQAAAVSNHWVSETANFLGKETIINAPLPEVSIALATTLKPDRKLISAIKVSKDKLEEVTSLAQVTEIIKAQPDVPATTVAKPVRGCPPTEFDAAELKAREVLRNFLSLEQIRDFDRYNKFVAMGVDTGHRYMITSRQARDEIALYQRSFYDLDERRALCAHDWTVPPAEEMLALFVCISTVGNELKLRELRPH